MSNEAMSATELAEAIFRDAIAAVRADRLIVERVRLKGDALDVADLSIDLTSINRIFVVGAGKASAAMASAMEGVLGDRLGAGIVVTKRGHGAATLTIEILEAGHPIPDEASVEAGRAIHELVGQAGERDLVICLLSGGASALMELQCDGVSLEDLRETTNLLLRSGATINDLNAVRACLSRLKAGGLARAAFPARVTCLAISDVLGNPLDVIGSGPCYLPAHDVLDAVSVLMKFDLWERVPEAVRQTVQSTDRIETDPAKGHVDHIILADIWTAIDAARGSAVKHGLKPAILTASLQGEARDAGRLFGQIARDLPKTYASNGIDCYIAGGETTVTVTADGKGGRSQEIATAAAIELDGVHNVALLAAGTDGTDGPTEVAGGLVDGMTLNNAAVMGASAQATLKDNDTYSFLEAANSHVLTGPTQTNVGDLVIVVYSHSPRRA